MKQQLYTALLGLTSLALSSPIMAQDALSNRWKESRRLDLHQKEVSFTDTFYLNDVTAKSLYLRKGAFQYKGTINKRTVDLGYITLSIEKRTDNEIQLKDDQFIHIFTRQLKEQSAADAALKKTEIALPATPVQQISLPMISGKWEAYKREGKDGPLPKVDYTTLITRVIVTGKDSIGHYGQVYTNKALPAYQITAIQDSNIIAMDKNNAIRRFTVWRLSPDELVLEDENHIVYYMKHFR